MCARTAARQKFCALTLRARKAMVAPQMPSSNPDSYLPSRGFQPRVYGVGAWTDSIHFAYDLVATVRARVLVELGTDRGESYFTFCQSAVENNTGTRCFAVDTWRGDQQAGGYDETTFEEVTRHNDAHYAGFSVLLRSTFDDALSRFGPNTIDVLHLDGLHTENAVRHDVQAWLPKLRPGGIFLMHDVTVRTRDFAVWKVWDELRRNGRSYTFENSAGLGVWQKPPDTQKPEWLETLLSGSSDREQLVSYYREKASELQRRIAEHWQDRTIGGTAAGHQSVIQVFHTHDGEHREEDSVLARIGHGKWKHVCLSLPPGAGTAPLRIDFVSPFTRIDLASIQLTSGEVTYFAANDPSTFEYVRIGGDAEREPHHEFLRVRVTGLDPQLYLPPVELPANAADVQLRLRLRVNSPSSGQ